MAALLVASVWLPAAAHAAGLIITPGSVAADYAGTITLNISGLPTGQAVLVETFLDTDENGVVDAGEMLVQSFPVTDGQALSIGGVRNGSVPGDEDGAADGNIRTELNFQALAETPKGVAKFVYKISPGTGSFTPVTAPFTVTQPAYAQQVVGQVTSGGSAVPFAFVFLIHPSRGGPVVAAIADAGGNFTLNAAPGTYALGALKSGFVFDFNTAPQVTINTGETVPQNVSLTAADPTISGRLTDADSGAGIPGVQLTAESGDPGLLTLAFTDANGNFSIPVSASLTQWRLDPSEAAAALLGYLYARDGYSVTTGGGSVSGVAIQWSKATALIYGTLKDDQEQPVAGLSICADDGSQYRSCVRTDSGGHYAVGVRAGTWHVNPDEDDLAARGYLGQGTQVTLGAGAALLQDLVVRHPTAHLIGRVVDDGSNAVGNICIYALPDAGGAVDTQTDANGNFSLGVFGGTWHLSLCSEDAQQRGLVGQNLPFTVTDGADITDIQYVARYVTAHITGQVKDSHNVPLAGVGVSASITAGGFVYYAWQQTDSSGNFSLGVFNGTWGVNLDCGTLQSRGYICPSGKSVLISGAGRVANFTVQPLVPLQVTTVALPAGQVGVFYSAQFQATGGQPPYTWSLVGVPTQPPGLNLAPDGSLSGTPTAEGTFNFTVRVRDSTSAMLDKGFSLQINSAPMTCVGDCSQDSHVTVDEILTMVNIALGNGPVSACDVGDANGDDAITVDEILSAVHHALNGC